MSFTTFGFHLPRFQCKLRIHAKAFFHGFVQKQSLDAEAKGFSGVNGANLVDPVFHRATKVGKVRIVVVKPSGRKACGLLQCELGVLHLLQEDLVQFVRTVVVQMEKPLDATSKAFVGLQDVGFHVATVARKDDNELVTVFVHELHEHVQTLFAVGIAVFAVVEGWSFVDKQHAGLGQGFLHHPVDFGFCLSFKIRNKVEGVAMGNFV